MKSRIIFFYVCLLISNITYAKELGQAVCIVPVVDLIGSPLKAFSKEQPASCTYHNIPPAHNKNPLACPRIHQLLFNEIVTILDRRGDEVLVELPNLFYQTPQSSLAHTTYWTQAKALMSLTQLQKKGVDFRAFPHPISRDKNELSLCLYNTLSLSKPFTDPAGKTMYSAGTRFVLVENRNTHTHDNTYAVWVFDPKIESTRIMHIPKDHAHIFNDKNIEERIKDFVAIVRSWANNQHGFIPYVLGGCSIGQFCTNGFQKTSHSFVYAQQKNPCTGLDCTGLVSRGAQLAGLPFFFKNSTTMAENMQSISRADSIMAGDLLWIPGHVMVISSVKQALLVEARHYYHGYGKVHEIPLHEQFQGMYTYKDLVDAYFEKKPLKRLDKQGIVVEVIDSFKILKLTSAWN